MSICMQCGAVYDCRHKPRRTPQPAPVDIRQQRVRWATEVRKRASSLRDELTAERLQALTHEQRVDVWVATRRAANALYSIAKDLDQLLLAEAGNSRGFVDSNGFPVEVKRRFETELLDEDEFAAWAAERGVDPFETKVALTREAKDAVKKALVEDGEKPPGVSAGMGNPFLSLGKVS